MLTVNGRAEAVLMGTHSYEQVLEAMEELETIKSIQRGLEDMGAGGTLDAKRVHERLRKR